MSDRISGPEVMAAFGDAIDNGVSTYTLAAFYLGVAAGQYFSRGWSREELEKELTNLGLRYPKLAQQIRENLPALTIILQEGK